MSTDTMGFLSPAALRGLQPPFFSLGTTQGPFAQQYAPPTPPHRPCSQIFPTLGVDLATAITATSPTSPSALDESSEPTPSTSASTTSPISPNQDDARLALEIVSPPLNRPRAAEIRQRRRVPNRRQVDRAHAAAQFRLARTHH
ncbi:hypothetical protein V496_01681 [Pseudogymnoascus sp. VKM F-4515 (FW-2607)]|nr:hypothetical protein V496_01681 [Pseudogymnoascus sp. VKM F-4515 (FW-2607)]